MLDSALEASREPSEEALQAIRGRAVRIFTELGEYFRTQLRQAYE
jgi:hypothetical protein